MSNLFCIYLNKAISHLVKLLTCVIMCNKKQNVLNNINEEMKINYNFKNLKSRHQGI